MENRGYSIYEIGILGDNDKSEIKFILFLMFIDYCNRHKLRKSSGSDFHIDRHYLGYANKGKYAIDDDLVRDWIGLVKKL